MSRRKINAFPERLVDQRARQLSWNMANCDRNAGSVNVAILSDMSNIQSSNNETMAVDSSSDDEIGDIFYKLKISDYIFVVDSSSSLLGCLNGAVYLKEDCIQPAHSETSLVDGNIRVRLCVKEDSVSSETADLANVAKGFLKLSASYEQIDGLAYLQKQRIIEVVANFDEVVDKSPFKVMVYLNEKGFTSVNIPSEVPSMRKNFKSMKILMQWLHGPWFSDMQNQTSKHYDDQIESIFNSLKSKTMCFSSATDTASADMTTAIANRTLDKLQHPSLVPLLRSYQKRAVQWMIEQESIARKGFAQEDKISHPLWKKIDLGDKQAWYNPHTGRISKDPIYHQGYPSGGILADEMGLGKTVEVLACILNNPRMAETNPKETIVKFLCDSPCRSMASDDMKDVLVKDPCKVVGDKGPNSFEQEVFPSAVNDSKGENVKADQTQSDKKISQTIEQSQVVNLKKRSLPVQSVDVNARKQAKLDFCNASLPHPKVDGAMNDKIQDVQLPRTSPADLVPHDIDGRVKKLECVVNDKNNWKMKHDIGNRSEITLQNNERHEILAGRGSKDITDRVTPKGIHLEGQSPLLVDQKEKLIRCVCGKNKPTLQEEILTCMNCSLSQHPKCIGLKKETEEKYVCPDCSVKMPMLKSNATLIVSPVTIARQWLDEIHRHILPGSLNVMVYEGVAQQGFVYPEVLAENDIILTTYEVLKRDFHHLLYKQDSHSYRRPKKYPTWPCPLTRIKFWRICLDEAQMVENTTAKTTETALNLSAVHRWCVTGTPIQNSMDDLYGLFLFLDVEPYCKKLWWRKLLYEPFLRGDVKPLCDVLYNVMWRTAKKDVIKEINIPEQKESLNWLNFSPVEYHFYRRQYEECSRSALKELKKFQESETELNSLDRWSVRRVLWPLLKLRQACCHPQAVRGGYLAVQKNLVTMEQLLESLINKAINESQDAHRLLLCALNGLAGTYVLQENWQDAVEVYREAMASWKEHDELIKTDSLQKLHTLHNLNDILSKFNSTSRTLRDDFLEQEAAEIRRKYLEKWEEQLKAAKNDALSAEQACKEVKQKVDLNCPWWINYLQAIRNNSIVCQRLMDKIKADLAAVTNAQEYASVSMADSFSDLRGLQLLLVGKFDAIEDCRQRLLDELKNLMVEPTKEMVVAAAECCLRPAMNSTAESCCFCRTNDVMSVYESLIFGHQGMSNTDIENVGGLRAENEAVRTLKSIYSFLKSQRCHDKSHHELQQQAQRHLEYMDLIKKNFKTYRQLWHALRQRVSALDELAMCTMRLRLRYRGEVVQDNQLYIVEPLQIESTQMGFRSDKVLATSSLRKYMGQLLYLKNLAKTQSTDEGENSELCPVCTKVLGFQWSVFSCGHCLCCQCMWVLLERPGIPGRAGSNVKCPMCREITAVQDISYVSTIRQLTDEDKDLVVKGSHSTKIEAAVRTLMRIQRTDADAKTLVFSTWQDVLDVIAHALVENDMKFRNIKKSKDFQSSLEEFKSSNDLRILLLPLQSGSNGLNIIEATHVILVEPSLNPSLERQAVGRIHRIGQTKPTFIHRILIANTVEEKIMRFLQSKVESRSRCGTRKTDGENIPLTVGELASFFQPADSGSDVSRPDVEHDGDQMSIIPLYN